MRHDISRLNAHRAERRRLREIATYITADWLTENGIKWTLDNETIVRALIMDVFDYADPSCLTRQLLASSKYHAKVRRLADMVNPELQELAGRMIVQYQFHRDEEAA